MEAKGGEVMREERGRSEGTCQIACGDGLSSGERFSIVSSQMKSKVT